MKLTEYGHWSVIHEIRSEWLTVSFASSPMQVSLLKNVKVLQSHISLETVDHAIQKVGHYINGRLCFSTRGFIGPWTIADLPRLQ